MNATCNHSDLVGKLLARFSDRRIKGDFEAAIDAGDDAVLDIKGMLPKGGQAGQAGNDQKEGTDIPQPPEPDFDTKLNELAKCLAMAVYSIKEAAGRIGKADVGGSLFFAESSMCKLREAWAIEVNLRQQLQKEEGLKIGN